MKLSGPERRGFGTELIERTLAYELGGQASLRFEPGACGAPSCAVPWSGPRAGVECQRRRAFGYRASSRKANIRLALQTVVPFTADDVSRPAVFLILSERRCLGGSHGNAGALADTWADLPKGDRPQSSARPRGLRPAARASGQRRPSAFSTSPVGTTPEVWQPCRVTGSLNALLPECENSARDGVRRVAESLRHESVTGVSGINRHPCVRAGQ